MHLHQKMNGMYMIERAMGSLLAQYMDMLAAQGDQESSFSEVVISPMLTFVVNSLNNPAMQLAR